MGWVVAVALICPGGCGSGPRGDSGAPESEIAPGTADTGGSAGDDGDVAAVGDGDREESRGLEDAIGEAGAGPACTSDSDCDGPTPWCDPLLGVCARCRLPQHCPGGGARCVGGVCKGRLACQSDKDCATDDGVCDKEAGACVNCLEAADCDTGMQCLAHQCLPAPKACESSKQCKGFGGICDKKKGACVDCVTATDCEPAQFCADGLCLPDLCSQGETICHDEHSRGVCKADGSGFSKGACGAAEVCSDGDCLAVLCKPGTKDCQEGAVIRCDALGVVWKLRQKCAAGTLCVAGSCLEAQCTPGASRCEAGKVLTCTVDGQGWVATACPSEHACLDDGKRTAGSATCKPRVCKPGTRSCADGKALKCAADGQKKELADDCAKPAADGTKRACKEGVCEPLTCVPDASTCVAGGVYLCDPDGLSGTGTPCPTNQACAPDGGGKGIATCKDVICTAGIDFCKGKVLRTCNKTGTASAQTADCAAAGKTCAQGKCLDYACQPGTRKCGGGGTRVVVCKPDGLATLELPCKGGTACVGAVCKPVICKPGELLCVGNAAHRCDPTGTSTAELATCPDDKACLAGACVAKVCTKGTFSCNGLLGYKVCNDNETGWVSKKCPDGTGCDGEACVKQVCTPGLSRCKPGTQITQKCHSAGVRWEKVADCAEKNSLCVAGRCKQKVCKVGARKCAAGKLLQCAADELSWESKVCGKGTACDGGQCLEVVCQAGVKRCDGRKAMACNALGTEEKLVADCPVSGRTCDQGKCVQPVCLPGAATCTSGKLATCGAMGLSYHKTACGPAKVCDGGACKKTICKPGALRCDAMRVLRCVQPGLSEVVDADCAGKGRACDGGRCVPRKCNPGSTRCEQGLVATCGTDALSWKHESCPAGSTCDPAGGSGSAAAACDKVVCQAGASFCAGNALRRCNASGTASAVVKACADTQTCLADGGDPVCKDHICAAGASKCKDPKTRLTCSGDRTRYFEFKCGATALCDPSKGACREKICVLDTLQCDGYRPRRCVNLGLDWQYLGDCAQQNKACKDGACTTAVCSPGAPKCFGDRLGVCRKDSLGYHTTPCADGNLCTLESCKGFQCVLAETVSCDDGNACTKEACNAGTGKCDTTKLGGPCDDGDACTHGDSCQGGVCRAAPAGEVATFSGSGAAGYNDGGALLARYRDPYGLTLGKDGKLYMVDYYHSSVRRIAADGSVTRIAGNPVARGYHEGKGSSARFYLPTDIETLEDGDLIVADYRNNRVRRVTTSGSTSLYAGSGAAGYRDGAWNVARFYRPTGVGVAADGSVYVAEHFGQRIRRISASRTVSLLAGSPGHAPGWVDAKGAVARFSSPYDVFPATDGYVYVTDQNNHVIRRIDKDGVVTTVAGVKRAHGTKDGKGVVARLWTPRGMAAAPGGGFYFASRGGQTIRHFALDGTVTTIAGTPGTAGSTNGKAGSATFRTPDDVVVDAVGRIFVSDEDNNLIRVIKPATTTCGDGNPCTADACDKQSGKCGFKPLSPGAECDDGNACTGAGKVSDSCDTAGKCGGPPTQCNDGKKCTMDSCDESTGGCVFAPIAGCVQ